MAKHVLVVDDDRDHAESVAEILEMRGHRVELAYTGEQAIVRFCEADFDMVLMDVKLPGMNGVQTFFEFRRLRADARVLMMTGYSVEQLLLTSRQLEGGARGGFADHRLPFTQHQHGHIGILRESHGSSDLSCFVE